MSYKYSAGLIPIDTRILEEMTKEGTELAEFIPLGPSVKALAKRIDGITGSQIAGRIRVLEALGYCVPIPLLPASQGRGWQRTAKGDTLLENAREKGVMVAVQEANETVNEEKGDSARPRDTLVTRHYEPGQHSVKVPEIEPEELDWGNAEVFEGPGGEEE